MEIRLLPLEVALQVFLLEVLVEDLEVDKQMPPTTTVMHMLIREKDTLVREDGHTTAMEMVLVEGGTAIPLG